MIEIEERIQKIEEEISELSQRIKSLKEEEYKLASSIHKDYSGKFIKIEELGCRYVYMYVQEQSYEFGRCYIKGFAMTYTITAKESSFSIISDYCVDLSFSKPIEITKETFVDNFEKSSKHYTDSIRRKLKSI